MGNEQNLAVVHQIYAAFGRGDLPGMLALLDSEVSWVTPGPSDLPTGGRRTGHAEVMEFFATLVGLLDIVRFTPEDLFASGEKVVVLGDEEARVKATGQTVRNRWVQVFTLRDGKVVAFEEIFDTAPLVAALRGASV